MTNPKDTRTGISNRETASEEERERREHPSTVPDAEDTDALTSEDRLSDVPQEQSSNKTGTRSIAQKESESRYTNEPAPPSRKVPGAYGKEEDDIPREEGPDTATPPPRPAG